MWGSQLPAWSLLATISSTTIAWSAGWMSRWNAQHADGLCPHPNSDTTPFCSSYALSFPTASPPHSPLPRPSLVPNPGVPCWSGASVGLPSTQQAEGGWLPCSCGPAALIYGIIGEWLVPRLSMHCHYRALACGMPTAEASALQTPTSVKP